MKVDFDFSLAKTDPSNRLQLRHSQQEKAHSQHCFCFSFYVDQYFFFCCRLQLINWHPVFVPVGYLLIIIICAERTVLTFPEVIEMREKHFGVVHGGEPEEVVLAHLAELFAVGVLKHGRVDLQQAVLLDGPL